MQHESKEIKDAIRFFIHNTMLKKIHSFSNDEDLFEINILDSIELLRLINHIEQQYQIVITPIEITIDNFKNISKISTLIEQKLSKKKIKI